MRDSVLSRRHSTGSSALEHSIIALLREAGHRFGDIESAPAEALLERIGNARAVLLGEASHGTSEFYQMRARITRALIERKGFTAMALEADWPDAARVDRYVRGFPPGGDQEPAFARFPTWMWRNQEFGTLVEWIRAWNADRSEPERKVRIVGLDLYSLFTSIEAVLGYLDQQDPSADAERYYRSMYYGSVESWNLRDSHMFETLERVLDFLAPDARAVVWAHKSHLGDASATELGRMGEHNVGQLCRERFGDAAYLVGFGTDHGTVAAASDWGGPMERMPVRPAHPASYEWLCHASEVPAFFLPLRDPVREAVRGELSPPRLERAIGVIYRTDTELQSHYFEAELPKQFDEYCWFDETNAVNPVPPTPPDKA